MQRVSDIHAAFFARKWETTDTVETLRHFVNETQQTLVGLGRNAIIPEFVVANAIIAKVKHLPVFQQTITNIFQGAGDNEDLVAGPQALRRLWRHLSNAEHVAKANMVQPAPLAMAAPARFTKLAAKKDQRPPHKKDTGPRGDDKFCECCRKRGHLIQDCFFYIRSKEFNAKVRPVPTTPPTTTPSHVTLLVVSGASRSLVNDARLLSNVKDAPDVTSVDTASGSSLSVSHCGTLSLAIKDENNKPVTLVLPETLLAEDSPYNLLSTTSVVGKQGSRTGHAFTQSSHGAQLQLSTGEIIPLQEQLGVPTLTAKLLPPPRCSRSEQQHLNPREHCTRS